MLMGEFESTTFSVANFWLVDSFWLVESFSLVKAKS